MNLAYSIEHQFEYSRVFDQNLFGHEIEPLDLILELTSELKSTGKDLNFRKFNGIADLEKQVKESKSK